MDRIEARKSVGYEADQLCVNRLFGFLLGSTLTGAGIYYSFLDEYMVANEALTDDITVRSLPWLSITTQVILRGTV